MNTFKYTQSNHVFDINYIKNRIKFYLEIENFEINNEDSDVNIIFEENLTKDQMLKLDVSMSSLAYVRF
jgi:hypothetical protein